MQSSSAYECYANVILPRRRKTLNGFAVGPNAYHISAHNGHESLPTEPEYIYDHYSDYSALNSRQNNSLPCYECLDVQNAPASTHYVPINDRSDYDINDQRRHLEGFGLSKKGLLQIDYSLSWMNLQRVISGK